MSIETFPSQQDSEETSQRRLRQVQEQNDWIRDLLQSLPPGSDERRVVLEWLELANQ